MNEHPDAEGVQIYDFTVKGKMLFIMFQTFAYMQIMSMINVRRPSYRDINPLSGINRLTVLGLTVLLVL